MDLLGTILKTMERPPRITERQRRLMQKLRDEHVKRQRVEKERLKEFRDTTQDNLERFIKDPTKKRLKFPPMNQVLRGIVHEFAGEAGMTSYAFGQEGVDRYLMVYKKEFPPSEDELTVLRRGEEWTVAKAKEMAAERELAKAEAARSKVKEEFTPNSNYREKYQHLIGLEAAKDAAKVTQTNKQYGFVPSASKKDHRSIEEAMADIQNKKRRKVEVKAEIKEEPEDPDVQEILT